MKIYIKWTGACDMMDGDSTLVQSGQIQQTINPPIFVLCFQKKMGRHFMELSPLHELSYLFSVFRDMKIQTLFSG